MKQFLDILKKNQNVKFIICGEGNLNGKIGKEASEEEIKDKVIFIGIIPNDIKEKLLCCGRHFRLGLKIGNAGNDSHGSDVCRASNCRGACDGSKRYC